MLPKDQSRSIISMLQHESKSIINTERNMDYQKQLTAPNQASQNALQLSDSNIPKRPLNLLKFLNKSRESRPYRLCIKRVYNLPSISKKSNSSSILFLQYSVKLWAVHRSSSFVKQVQQVGECCQYQCQESLYRKDQSRHEFGCNFYYHSRVGNNQGLMFLTVGVRVVQMRGGVVENVHNMGFFVVQNPFTQTSQSSLPLCKQQLHQQQFAQFQSYKQMSKNSQGAKVDYQIVSAIQLKKLTKLVPENVIVSTQTKIVGLNDQFLNNQTQLQQIIQTSTLTLKIKYLQLHIPQSFQEEILRTLRAMPNSLFGGKDEIKSRRIIIGYFTTSNLINSIEKRLQFVDRQQAGQIKISIYQAIKDNETINYPYYLQDLNYPVVFSLVYQVNQKEIETAYYMLTPVTNGETHDISQQMNTTQAQSCPFIKESFVRTLAKNKPTLITQYVSEQILMDDQSFISGFQKGPTNMRSSQNLRSSQNFMRSSQKVVQDRSQQLKQKEKLLQQIEYQKLQLEKQRSEIQKIKSQNYVLYQEEFETRFLLQKQALAKRQEMLQLQYREQVQREIREKAQLQEQIKEMKETVRRIQQQNQQRRKSGYFGQSNTNNNPSNDYPISNQPFNQFPTGPFFPGQMKLPFVKNYNQPQTPQYQQKQKIDPGYLLQTENAIPVTKVRQMIQQRNNSTINSNLIQLSRSQFNRASVFKFTFSSITWNNQVQRPKEIYFIVRFFNFPQYKTDRVRSFGDESSQGYSQLVRSHQFHYGNDDPTPTYTFVVDPSEYRNPKLLQADLIQYLAFNSCIVDILDGQTHIYLGQINIKLSQLIRGNKTQTFIAKEYNLIKIKTRQHLGAMQVVVKNEEAMCKEEMYVVKTNTTVKDEKKKVVSYVPMSVPKSQQLNNISSVQRIHATSMSTNKDQQSSNRLQQRISQFKQRQRQKKLDDHQSTFVTLQQNQKSSILAKISQHKQKTMPQYIKTVYSTLLHENITINAEFGRAQTFPYTFVNQGSTAAAYKIVVDENGEKGKMDINKLNVQEGQSNSDLQVIKDAMEWRYYVKKKGYSEPRFYQIINDNNVFYLNPGQSLTMVFKYLTFSPVQKYSISQQKLINVSVIKQESNWIAGGFALTVQLHEQVVHHSYMLYQPGSQLVELIMPVVFTRQQEYGPGHIKKLYITDQSQETEAQWLNQYQILLKFTTPEIMQRKTFNLLLYDDEYFDQLKENWLIVVNSYQGVWAQCRSDYTTKLKLSLPMNTIPLNLSTEFTSSLISNYLRINSSDISLHVEESRILVEMSKMRDNGAIQIWCEIIGNSQARKQIVVTCTGEDSCCLVYGWVVQVIPWAARRG